ncbi:MAG TPA: asparagine synthase (glutamine-hydrolyzing) [Pyrinomonadaceae bacterium]|nr:asparagine synthase (glutamine-hydrolyzing) [Pyrinomonadaceae bacterium]
MCGIVGVAGEIGRDEALSVVARMNEAIFHRGPDDEGSWAEDGFAFGMRRLSIIDLSGGHQPMWDDRTGLGVVFNGEVYNYRELRERMTREGETWATHSDTEVVLKSLARSGLEGVNGWNGMFAVAAYDARDRSLLLVRDRMGVKPLYYFWDGRRLLFASEVKALLASGLVPRRLDRQAVWDYLTYRYVPGPSSVWEGVRKLPPGHALKFSPGGAPEEVRYWHSEVLGETNGHGARPEQTDREFAELFLDAVNLRLVASDVPVGVFLSGGLDSSAVAAAAVELGHRNFHTFSVGFDEGGYFSELPHARRMAEHVGAQYHEVVLDREQFLELLPEAVYHSDEPLADLTVVPLLALSRLARHDVKVVLSGEGSDEVLAGYDLDESERLWSAVRSLQRLPRPVLGAGARLAGLALPGGLGRRALRVGGEPLSDWNRRDRPHITRYWSQGEKARLWPGGAGLDSERILAAQYGAARSADPLQQLLAVYQQSWLVEDLLMKADKMTMAASLEARTPFLDYRLVEWANRQPNRVKIGREGLFRYRTKEVLRRFCERRLPAEVLRREKRGFPVPAYGWLREGLDRWAAEKLLGPESRTAPAFSREEVEQLISAARAGAGDAAHRVWMLVILELWLRAWDASLG